MSNSLLSLTTKTKFQGIYKKETKKGIAFISRYTLNKKTKTQIVGYEYQGMTEYDAFKIRLDLMTSAQLSIAIETHKEEAFLLPKLFKQFINFRSPLLAKNTIANYQSIYNQYIKKDFEFKDVRDLTSDELQKYINKLLTYRRPATVEKIVSAFKKFYQYLQNKDIYRYNPSTSLIMPKYDNKKYFSITKKDVNRIVTYISTIESQLYKTLYFLLFHGRRVDETRTLLWSSVDLESKVYYLDYEKTKNRKNQYFYLEEFQIIELKKLKKLNPNSKYLFENPKTKQPITYSSIFRIHKKLRLELNLPSYSLHSIRHTTAFLLVNNGYSLEIVAKLLGHSDIKSTSRYAVLEMNKAQKAYKTTIANLFNK